MKRSFLCESDDLVDELLTAINKHGWSDLKMKYELGSLSASRSVRAALADGAGQGTIGKLRESKYLLTAKWEEQAEEVELTLTVEGEDASSGHLGASLAEEIASALFAESTYRHVTARDDL